jgi:hypothetical protein
MNTLDKIQDDCLLKNRYEALTINAPWSLPDFEKLLEVYLDWKTWWKNYDHHESILRLLQNADVRSQEWLNLFVEWISTRVKNIFN